MHGTRAALLVGMKTLTILVQTSISTDKIKVLEMLGYKVILVFRK